MNFSRLPVFGEVDVLRVLLATLSTSVLLSLAGFIFLSVWDGGRVLQRIFAGSRMTILEAAFCILAGIGLLTCIYQGTEAMLSWMPSHWGRVGEDGEYERLSTYIAGVLTLPGTAVLAKYLTEASVTATLAQIAAERALALERLLHASLDEGLLAWEINRLEARIMEARRRQVPSDSPVDDLAWRDPQNQRIGDLMDVLHLARQHQQHLAARTHARGPESR